MKTSYALPLHDTGYPSKVEANKREEASLPLAEKVKKQDVVAALNKTIDHPSNWDESWFSNYE